MPSQLTPGPSGAPRPPITYSRRSATSRNADATSNIVKDEAKREETLEGIVLSAHGGNDFYENAARRATRIDYCLQNVARQSKMGSHTISSLKAGKRAEQSESPRAAGNDNASDEDEEDIAEAIARSLGKTIEDRNVVRPFPSVHDDSNIAETKILSLLAASEPAKSTARSSSYGSTGSGSTSGSTPPHIPLHALLNHIRSAAKNVQELDTNELARRAPELTFIMNSWQNTVAKVLSATEAAELKRIQDIQGHLDYDQALEEECRKKLNALGKRCGAQVLQMKQGHQKELMKQKEMYEAYISQHMAKPPTPRAPALVRPAFVFTAGGRGFPEQQQMSSSSNPGPPSDEGPGWARKRARLS
ncbi:uncharacterized protein J4E78_007576 [Alternaria triticimaculans]|uniref:uncharacterized protein n=1 Tax=Alternaria triticimaculans TaxID=297637 RepID=UPI0020C308FC|nr:uncharacterized protein J4E78_007576 [Alternaria triticimaculans]KAI4652749.1 hypothetical protein J4E78_007576 [Alternaria triticimaculans]